MKITIDYKLTKEIEPYKKRQKNFGNDMAYKIEARLNQLSAAATLEDMRNTPGKTHELKGNYKGHFAIHLIEPARLIFKPDDDPAEYMENGSINWSKVRAINIISFEQDYH